MQVVVTGAGSELGQHLLRALVAGAALRGFDGVAKPLRRIIGVDRVQPATLFVDERIEYVRGDYDQPRFLARMMGAATDSVFHLAARDVGAAGADDVAAAAAFAHAIDATRALLDACAFQTAPPRIVYAGLRGLRRAPGDVPAGAEGICVDICESLLVAGARRGIIDLCSVRLAAAAADVARDAALLVAAHDLEDRGAAQRIVETDDGAALRPAGGP